MSAALGQGSLGLTPGAKGAGAATVTGANNGTSLSGTDVQLGQDIGAVGDPAALLSAREIPMEGFSFNFKGLLIDVLIDDVNEIFQVSDSALNQFLYVDPQNSTYWLGDIPGVIDNTYFYLDNLGFEISSNGKSLCGNNGNVSLFGEFAANVYLRLDNTPGSELLTLKCVNGVRIDSNGSFLLNMFNPMANNAAANAATLNNAPAAGDPTKWIAILDGGVTRYIPCW